MPGEVRFHVDVDATGRFEFRMRSGRHEVTSSVNPDLAASFFEDLRLLRWKSIGIHDPGDSLLTDVGDRLAALVAAPATWERLRLPDDARQVRVYFSQAAHRLMQFPWELLRVNNRFLIGNRGSHLKRELPSPVPKLKTRNPVTNIVHVSLGTDSNLRLDEERCILLETMPANIPIEFLFYSSARRLEVEIDAFRPHIVIVSGHGHYDELQGEHFLSLPDDGYIRTAEIVALCASYGCKLLVLSTCESVRLGGPVVDEGTVLPADVIAFSFPVMTTTATQSIECLLREVIRGRTIDDAMAAVRAIDMRRRVCLLQRRPSPSESRKVTAHKRGGSKTARRASNPVPRNGVYTWLAKWLRALGRASDDARSHRKWRRSADPALGRTRPTITKPSNSMARTPRRSPDPRCA